MHPYSPPSTHPNNTQHSRKRQHQQTAAIVVKPLWSRNLGRKSTAQPRPVLFVPPRGTGPTVHPNLNDVLCGRGGRINSHAGNIQFREITSSLKKNYLAKTTKKLEKAHIASRIINNIRSMEPPGRFLKEDQATGLWFDIGDAKAIKKAGQSLREAAPGIRHEIDGDSSRDDKGSSSDDEPKKSTASASSPTKRQSSQTSPRQGHGFVVSGRGSQHLHSRTAPCGQQDNDASLAMIRQDYQAQVAMLPPYSHQVHSYNADDRSFQAQIPIQSPHSAQIYSLPYQSVVPVRQIFTSTASRHEMEALNQVQPTSGQYPHEYRPPDGIAFGRQFYPPNGTPH
jgi:hypothetical protein